MIEALGWTEWLEFLGLVILMDVPRYLLAALVLMFVPSNTQHAAHLNVSGLVACHNEEGSIGACIASMRAAGVEQIVVVNDGSSDRTRDVAAELGATVVDLVERRGRATALNTGLLYCTNEFVLVTDADTTFEPDSVERATNCFEPNVAGVGMHLTVQNENATLTTRFQAIEYLITFTGNRITDALGIMPNVSGAAGLFRRAALTQVDGYDFEVNDDAALAMKLRVAGWQLRYAPLAYAHTNVPETIIDLTVQRLRWDAGIITVWWRKFGFLLNPFSKRFGVRNLLTSLDVLVFGALLPLILPVYLFWLWHLVGTDIMLIFVGTIMFALTLIAFVIVLLLELPLRLLPYFPLYIPMQMLVMKPVRIIALIGELAFNISHRDDYIPAAERWRLT